MCDGVWSVFPGPHEEVFVGGGVSDGGLNGGGVPGGANAVCHDEELCDVFGAVVVGALFER